MIGSSPWWLAVGLLKASLRNNQWANGTVSFSHERNWVAGGRNESDIEKLLWGLSSLLDRPRSLWCNYPARSREPLLVKWNCKKILSPFRLWEPIALHCGFFPISTTGFGCLTTLLHAKRAKVVSASRLFAERWLISPRKGENPIKSQRRWDRSLLICDWGACGDMTGLSDSAGSPALSLKSLSNGCLIKSDLLHALQQSTHDLSMDKVFLFSWNRGFCDTQKCHLSPSFVRFWHLTKSGSAHIWSTERKEGQFTFEWILFSTNGAQIWL